MVTSRFIDQKDIANQKDFVRRKYGYDSMYAALLLVLTWLLCLGAYSAFKGVNETAYYAVVTLIFAGSAGALYAFIRNDRDIMHALEFQNALFAAVTRHGSEFYAILNHTGNVVYIHPDYHRQLNCLVGAGSNSLEALCDIINMENDKRDLLIRLMREGKKGAFNFSVMSRDDRQPLNMLLKPIHMCTGEEYHKDITLVLEPITRPSGFFLLAAEKENPHTALVKNLDKLDVGYFTADEALNFSGASHIFAAAGGFSKMELTDGAALTDIFPEITAEAIRAAGDEQMPLTKVCRAQKKDGGRGEQYMVLATAIEEGTRRDAFIGVAVKYDSAAERVAFTLDDESAASMLAASPIASAVVAPSGAILYANAAFRKTLKADGELTRPLTEFVQEDMRGNVSEIIRRAADDAGGEAQHLRVDVTCGGETGTRFLTVCPLPAAIGTKPAHIAVYLTENDGALRLAECAAHSQKMQAVGQLAGGIAHDFNNLLTAMLGFCDMLLERHPAGDESFSDIMQVRQNANRAAGLVRQLLAFSRRQTLRPQVIDITDIVADLSDLLNRLLGENVRPDIRHGYNLHRVRVDIGQLEQVIVNLAVNARDAMAGDREGTLTVTTENIDIDGGHALHRCFSPENEKAPSGAYVMMIVKDNGTGIPEDALHNIFEPFFSTKEIGEGTGLGLATVYGIVKQNNGFIYVDTAEGEGTTFHILFPRHCVTEAEQAALNAAPAEEAPLLANQDVTGKGTILLVEDEAPVRMFSSSALKSKGYTVLEAENGFEALDMMEEHGDSIDIVITDVMMPGMSGPSFIENIQNDYPDLKVIFISGYAEDQFMEQFKDKHLFDFLPKPYSLKQLASKVKAMA